MTVRELIASSLRLLGAVAPGEGIEASEATEGLSALNQLVDSWSNEGLMIFAITEEEFALTANDQEYTMGSGADFDTTRPQRIEKARIKDETQTPAVSLPVEIITVEHWAELTQKAVESSYPYQIYVEYGYPNATIRLYPKPTRSDKLVLFSWKPLTTFGNLDTTISLPPGYERALRYNLASELRPEYGRAVDPGIESKALEAKQVLKRMNHRPHYLKADPALVNGRGYNILAGPIE